MTTDLPQDLPDRSPQPSPDAGPPLPAATEAVPNRGLGPRSGWARGAFAMFAPEQQTQLQADIVSPEGRILFAGEHCSLYHAWIQGALESGIRAARHIHEAPAND